MKYLITLLLVFSLLCGCAGSDVDGSVQLDGPILESINSEGNLEFNGAAVNTGATPVKNAVVVIILKDRQGKIIEATSTPLLGSSGDDVILPSERVFFTVTFSVDPGKIFFKDVEIFSENSTSSEDG